MFATGTFSITVTFSESGHPSGQSWSVTLNSANPTSSTDTTIAFSAAPGSTNSYTVEEVIICYPSCSGRSTCYSDLPVPLSGSFTDSQSATISVTFTLHITHVCNARMAECVS